MRQDWHLRGGRAALLWSAAAADAQIRFQLLADCYGQSRHGTAGARVPEQACCRCVCRCTPSAPFTLFSLACAGSVANALVGDTLRCSIPISSITPEQIFSKMEAARQSVGVRDWGVANASLEDVFIQVTCAHHAQASHSSFRCVGAVCDACSDRVTHPDRGRAQAHAAAAAGINCQHSCASALLVHTPCHPVPTTACTRTHTCTHAHAQTHKHTHAHTCTQRRAAH